MAQLERKHDLQVWMAMQALGKWDLQSAIHCDVNEIPQKLARGEQARGDIEKKKAGGADDKDKEKKSE